MCQLFEGKVVKMSAKVAQAIIFLIIIVVVLSAFAAFSLKKTEQIPTECKSFDGFCNPGCTFENDADCPKQEVIQPGTITACIADSDCVAVNAICNNEDCVYTANECIYKSACYIGINKNYADVWMANGVSCVGETPELACPDKANLVLRCERGTCQL